MIRLIICLFCFFHASTTMGQHASFFPPVFQGSGHDFISPLLTHEAVISACTHQLPATKEEWEAYRLQLREKIMEKTGVKMIHSLPPDMQELDNRPMNGYTMKNIIFQTRPGIYATGTLYVPEGKGPFPAVVVMMGHSRNGRLYETYQKIGHSLALNGYVSLSVDPWGAGERTTEHGDFEYHGANLGASLMNIGESLMGMQITDNMRAVDLLSSLPYVESSKIGATGASGGGNQTMWVSALDERIQAVVPVVSVGTFQSYIMESNCVCELLVDGLTFTEEAGVLGLIAPRALKICSAFREANKAFIPAEMFRSYQKLCPVYNMYEADQKLSYHIADLPHGYWPEFREAMLGWFDLHLRGIGTGAPKKENYELPVIPESDLMAFPSGKRDNRVVGTAEYCRTTGKELRSAMLTEKKIDVEKKKTELKQVLKLADHPEIVELHQLPSQKGWDRFIIETSFGSVIPVLHRAPSSAKKEYIIACSVNGKNSIDPQVYDSKAGVVLVDLWSTGENVSLTDRRIGGYLPTYHTLARACLWLGKRMLGQWTNELDVVSRFLKDQYGAKQIKICADKETGLAALFLATLSDHISILELHNTPVSYEFDQREGIDFFSMAVHLPGILKWGDLSLAAGMAGKNITFVHPVTMSGRTLAPSEKDTFLKEYRNMSGLCGQKANIIFK